MYIYIHIPFCLSICNYCDFPKCLYDKRYVSNYLESLKHEIEVRYQGEMVKTIFIGGGTPTSLSQEELEHLLKITDLFKKEDEIEFTIESNIESLDIDKIKLLKKYHVNRVSLGVQSFQESILKELNRNHTKEQVFEVVENLKEIGILNISMDYIYGVHSNLDEVKEDIDTFLKLDIPHISCYSLIIEENARFGIEKRNYIDEEIEYQMYQYIKSKLEEYHYQHYEVSNYARDGYQSIHNLNYWNNGGYYGFGLGAVSFLNNYRTSNTKSLTSYLTGKYQLESILESLEVRISNEFILGLRKIEGINIHEFEEKYHQDILDFYDVKELIHEGKLKIKNDHLCIADEYFYLSNEILVCFI